MTQTLSTPDIQPAALRSFLLGELSDADTEKIEALALEEEGVFELIGEAEDDLIDAYAHGRLSNAELRRFEEHFAQGGGEARRALLRERIALSQGLTQVATESASRAASVASTTRSSFSWRDLLPRLGPVLRPAFVLATVALAAFTGWFAWQSAQLRDELATERQAMVDTRAELEELRDATSGTQVSVTPPADTADSTDEDSEVAARLAEVEAQRDRLQAELASAREEAASRPAATPKAASFILALTGAVRGTEGPRRLRIPAGTDHVDLQVDLEGETGFDSYRLALRTVAGDEIWSRAGLEPSTTSWGSALELSVPVDSLTSGEYELMVFGNADGAWDELAFIEFRVDA